MYFVRFSNKFTDDASKSAFQIFLVGNINQQDINAWAKAIRVWNRINNPEKFFKAIGPVTNVTISGRQCRTVLIADIYMMEM